MNVPVDLMVQPLRPRSGRVPLLIEAKSAGDFTNTNKRRKEESAKNAQLVHSHGPDAALVLFLCGYFDENYLRYEQEAGIDWVWEHRVADLELLGV